MLPLWRGNTHTQTSPRASGWDCPQKQKARSSRRRRAKFTPIGESVKRSIRDRLAHSKKKFWAYLQSAGKSFNNVKAGGLVHTKVVANVSWTNFHPSRELTLADLLLFNQAQNIRHKSVLKNHRVHPFIIALTCTISIAD